MISLWTMHFAVCLNRYIFAFCYQSIKNLIITTMQKHLKLVSHRCFACGRGDHVLLSSGKLNSKIQLVLTNLWDWRKEPFPLFSMAYCIPRLIHFWWALILVKPGPLYEMGRLGKGGTVMNTDVFRYLAACPLCLLCIGYQVSTWV